MLGRIEAPSPGGEPQLCAAYNEVLGLCEEFPGVYALLTPQGSVPPFCPL